MILFLQKLIQPPKQTTHTQQHFDYQVKDAKLELKKIKQFTANFSRRYYEDPDPIKMAKQYSSDAEFIAYLDKVDSLLDMHYKFCGG